MFAREVLGSPGLIAICLLLPLKILAIVFIDVLFPEPKLYILLTNLLLITFINALAKSCYATDSKYGPKIRGVIKVKTFKELLG